MNNKIFVEGIHGHGAIIDTPDERDYKWSELGKSFAPFDWSVGYDIEEVLGKIVNAQSFKLLVNDQNGSGSCGGQALSKYGEVLSMIFNGIYERKSAKFIYAQTFVPGGGSDGRTNCNLVIKKGWGNESDTPSTDGGLPPTEAFMERKEDITPQAFQNALHDEALSYASVDVDIDSIAHAIQNNYGAVIGVQGQNNGTWLSNMPMQPSDSNPNPTWEHWIYAGKAKMINGKKYIAVLNSWGTQVGDNGWQWLSEEYFTTMCKGLKNVWSGWTLVYNATPTVIATKQSNWVIDLIKRFYTIFS